MSLAATLRALPRSAALTRRGGASDKDVRSSQRALFAAAFAGILLLAIAARRWLGVYTDDLWLLLLSDRMLDGQVAYRDFLENSPPAAILIYMPPVALARLIGVAREPVFFAYAFAVLGGVFLFCWRILAATGRLNLIGAAGGAAALAALFLLPDYQFGQRDHFAFALASPLLTILAVRASGGRVSRLAAIAAGVAAGAVCAIRPHYALAFSAALGFVAWRRDLRDIVRFPEISSAIAAAIAFAFGSLLAFPHYFDTALPIALAVYVADRHSLLFVAFTPIVAAWTLLAAAYLAQASRDDDDALANVWALASLGALLSYFVQAKGFAYHGYFAVAAMLVAVASQRATCLKRAPAFVLASLAGLAVVGLGLSGDIDSSARFELAAGFLAIVGLARSLAPAFAPYRPPLSALGVGAAAALSFASVHAEWRATPVFFDEVRSLVAHPKVAAIADIGEIAHPLVSRLEGQWTQSVISMVISQGADAVIERQSPDAALRAKLEAYKALDRDIFLSDVAREPPDVVIVDETWAEKHFVDKRVDEWLARFHKQETILLHRGGLPERFALYVRPELLKSAVARPAAEGLRGALAPTEGR